MPSRLQHRDQRLRLAHGARRRQSAGDARHDLSERRRTRLADGGRAIDRAAPVLPRARRGLLAPPRNSAIAGGPVMRPLAARWLVNAYVALFVLFMLAPLVFVIVNSFNQARFSTFPPPGLSFQWYVRLFTIPDFFIALRNSLVVAALSTVL